MSHSRGRKIKDLNRDRYDSEVFFMSLEEAKNFIADKYELMAERIERQNPKQVKPNRG